MACSCFSLCNEANASHFLNAIPSSIDSVISPWYGYLKVVYGAALALPFDLRRMEFFYASGHHWQALSGNTSWPMAACHRKSALDWEPCDAAECAAWLSTTETRRAPVAERDVSLQVLSDRGVTLGVIVRQRHQHWHPSENDTCVEVIRTSGQPGISMAPYESCTCDAGPSYGCWFLAATGTGMVLDLKRTLILPRKREGIAQLFRKYNATTGTLPPEASSKTLRSLFDRHLAFLAGHFGFYTAQVRFDELPHPVSEIVVTTRYACDVGSQQRYAAFRKTPCVPVPIRAVGGGDCACDPKQTLLNCRG